MEANFRHDPNISSSDLGQYIHDTYPVEFYFADIDGAIFKKSTKIKRVFECKSPGQRLKPSQAWLLQDISKQLEEQIKSGEISPESGVFIVWGDPPFDVIEVCRIGEQESVVLHGRRKDNFLRGLPLGTEE